MGFVMSLGLVWKVAAGAALLLILGTAATITYFNHTRPPALGLASATARTPAPPPVPGDLLDVSLAGDLDIGSVARPATFKLDVRLKDGQVTAAGQTTVSVHDYGIEVPEEAGGFVRVNPDIILEVSLILLKP